MAKTKYQPPSDKSLSLLLQTLIGEHCYASVCMSDERPPQAFRAIFVDNIGDARASCRYDFPTAVALGAALASMQPLLAKRQVEDGEMSAQVNVKLYEIMAELGGLFTDDAAEALTFDRAEYDSLPSKLPAPADITVFDIHLGVYGSGRLWISTFPFSQDAL